MLIYYCICFGLSIFLMILYFVRWHRHNDMLITILYIFIPIINLAYILLALSNNIEEALAINKIVYLGGCYLMFMIVVIVFNVCDVELPKWATIILLIITSTIYAGVLSIGYSDVFYKNAELIQYHDIKAIGNKEYGFMHTLHNIMLFAYIGLSLFAIIYSYFKRKQTSRKNIYMLFFTQIFGASAFFICKLFSKYFEVMPLVYDINLVIYFIIVRRMGMYNVADTAIDSIVETGETGFISFDFKLNYLGSNDTAKRIINELNNLVVDKRSDNELINNTLVLWVNNFIVDNKNNENHYKIDDKTYLFTINYLFDGFKNRGYQTERSRSFWNRSGTKLYLYAFKSCH